MNILLRTACFVLMSSLAIAAETQPTTGSATDSKTARVQIETSMGNIVVDLDAEKAPISVKNFLRYVDEGFYEGTIFHRVMPEFMIQGGGYTQDFVEKPTHPSIKNEWENGLKNNRGTIAMARRGDPNSATAQFYINVVDNPSLDQPDAQGSAYAVFGKVVEGMDVVDKIRYTPTRSEPRVGNAPAPITPVIIKRVAILQDIEREKPGQKAQENIQKFTQEAGEKLQKTESGLMYVPLQEGSGQSPTDTDSVKFTMQLSLADGTMIPLSNAPKTLMLRQINLAGLREGMKMMKPGGKAKMLIPPALAYGTSGMGAIPPDSTLMVTVDLLEVTAGGSTGTSTQPSQPGEQ